jgi:ABC-type Fe3+-hydroxamate transport system substrate-binding protein
VEIEDPFGVSHSYSPPYRRIVSLIPSVTESLFELGAWDQVVGITSYCILPGNAAAGKRRIGGTKNPDIPGILQLRPDLVIANVEENRKEDVDRLAKECAVYLNYPMTIPDVKTLLNELAFLTGTDATPFLTAIDRSAGSIVRRSGNVLYLVWNRPYWSLGEDTYVAEILRRFGYRNVCADRRSHYFPVTEEEISAADPELVLLPSEPFRFRPLHREEFALHFRDTRAVRTGRVRLIDGRMSSWFGTRTPRGIDYLNAILP